MTSIETPLTQSTSPSLLGRAASGESIAWQRIVQIYGPLVYSWARRTGLQSQDAADVTQETFAALAGRLATFDCSRPGTTFRGWLWTITRNKAADMVRTRQLQPGARGGSTNLAQLQAAVGHPFESSKLDSSDPPSDCEKDQHEVVRRALALMRTSFEPTTWQCFWRTVIDGCSPDQVAAEFSLSRWAVYKARSRVLHRLRLELKGLEEID